MPGGRPLKLTHEITEAVRQAVLAGAPLNVAAAHGHIHEATLHRYQARGLAALEAADWEMDDVSEDDRPFCEFYEAVQGARRSWELGQLAIIQQAARGTPGQREDGTPTPVVEVETRTTYDDKGRVVSRIVVEKRGLKPDWRAALTILERRNPQVYGKVYRAEITGPEGAPVEVQVDDLVARAERAVDELAERRERKAG